MRTALLARSVPARRPVARRGAWVLLPIAAAAGIFLVLPRAKKQAQERTTIVARVDPPGTASGRPVETYRGSVHSNDGATFMIGRGQPDEVVSLREGSIDVDVEPLHPGERFRVVTDDAQIEVRGTSFHVVARGDRLVSVDVLHGLVLVRPLGRAPALLGPRERWVAQGAALVPDVVRRKRAFERRAAASPHTLSAAPAQTAAEIAFADGWQALRGNRFLEASEAFERASATAGDQPLAEDAWFWMAVCQARVPRRSEARTSLARFVDRFPRSARRGEASAMLGWILLDDGDLEGAARRFAVAEKDQVGDVRRSARLGLDAIERKHRTPPGVSGSGGH